MVLEGVVEQSVQEGVEAQRRHGHDVAQDEEGVIKLPTVDGIKVKICDEIDWANGQPADPEHGHHAHQHPVGSLGAAELKVLAVGHLRRKSGTFLGPSTELDDDCGVAGDDRYEGQHELGDRGEDPVD